MIWINQENCGRLWDKVNVVYYLCGSRKLWLQLVSWHLIEHSPRSRSEHWIHVLRAYATDAVLFVVRLLPWVDEGKRLK